MERKLRSYLYNILCVVVVTSVAFMPVRAVRAAEPTPGVTTPGVDNPTPGVGIPTPGAVEPAPGADGPALGAVPTPEAGEPTPEAGEPTPGAGEPTPGAGEPTPGADGPALGAIPAPDNLVTPVISFNRSNGLVTDSYIDSDHLAMLLSVLNATVVVENGLPKVAATPELGAEALTTGSLVAGQTYYLILALSSGSDYFDLYSNMNITCSGSSGDVIPLEFSNETYTNRLTLAIPLVATDYSNNIREEIKTENTVCYFNGDERGNPALADKRTLKNIEEHTVLTKGSVISYEANNIPNNSVSSNSPAATSAAIYVDGKQVDSGMLTGGDRTYVLGEDLAYEKCAYDSDSLTIKLYMYTPIKVTFNSNGRGFESYSIRVAKGAKVKQPMNPSAPRWRFDGWTIDKKNKIDYDFDTPVTESITLYAKWALLNDIEASMNAALTPSVSGNEPQEESETQSLTNAMFGSGGSKDSNSHIAIPEVLALLQRTGLVLFEETQAEAEEAEIEVLEEPEEIVEPEYVEEIVVAPSPESPDMSGFKEIIVAEEEYTDSFPWFTALVTVFGIGAVAAIVVIVKNRKEWWDED